MSQDGDWVSAAEALAILEPSFSTYSAARRICERACAGLVRARAESFQIDGIEQPSSEIPKEFWWAKGHEALEQDWVAGDFSTWIKRQREWKAFNVTFSRSDIEKLLPATARTKTSVQTVEEKRADQHQELYIQLLHLEQTAPDFSRATTPDMRLWLAQTRAAINATTDPGNIASFGVALSMYSGAASGRAHVYGAEMLQCLYNALAHVGRSVPSSMRGAFIGAGNAYDALSAVGKILGEAKRTVTLIDPYADAAILNAYAVLAPEGVVVEILADARDVKPSLKPATDAWLKQYAALRPLEIRLGPWKALHDRLIIIDDTSAFVVGQSFNALGTRAPTSINRIVDAETAHRKIEAHRQIWNAATPLT